MAALGRSATSVAGTASRILRNFLNTTRSSFSKFDGGDASDPLLGHSRQAADVGRRPAWWFSWQAPETDSQPKRTVKVDVQFLRNLWKLLACVRASPALLLIALSVAEALATSAGTAWTTCAEVPTVSSDRIVLDSLCPCYDVYMLRSGCAHLLPWTGNTPMRCTGWTQAAM